MMKRLIIHPNRIDDMGNLLAVARAEGKRALCTSANVRVHPWIGKEDDCFVVIVENKVGRTNNQMQGKG